MYLTQYGGMQMGLDPFTKFVIKLAITAFSYNQQRKAQKRAERQARIARSNVLVNKQSNNDPIYVLYGKQRMGGTRVFIESSNGSGDLSSTTKLNMVIVMCEGEIGTVKQMYFNDTLVFDSDDGGTLTPNSSGGQTLGSFTSKYASYITCNWYPGTTTQTVDTALQGSVNSTSAVDATTIESGKYYEIVTVGTTDYTTVGSPNNTVGTQFEATGTPTGTGTVKLTPWTDNHRLQGVSYFAIQLEANGTTFGGQLPTMTMVLEGKKILDISQLTEGDTDSDLVSGDYTTSADQNPVDVLYDYLRSDIFGKGLDRDSNGDWLCGENINIASFKQARLDCAAARSGSGYKINGYLQTEKQLFDNVGEILEACNGILLFKDGKYELKIRKQNEQSGIPSSAIFTKDTIIGNINLTLPSKSGKLNKMTGVFANPDTKWNDDIAIHSNATYLAEDNSSVLEQTEEYTVVTERAIVEDLITQQVDISRDRSVVTFKAPHVALLLKSGDIIEIRHDEFGWGTGAGQTQKFFRVEELKLAEDNTVDITATTYDSSKEL